MLKDSKNLRKPSISNEKKILINAILAFFFHYFAKKSYFCSVFQSFCSFNF